MPIQTLHLRSSTQGKEPVAGTATGQLPVGSIAINFNATEPFLSIQDSAGVIRRIAGIKVGATAPATPTAGEAWLDTTVAAKPIFKVHDGTAWQGAGGGTASGTAQPSTPAIGDLWVDTSVAGSPVLKVYNGTAWVAVAPDATTSAKGVVQLADAAAVTAGTAGLVVTADQLKATNDAIATAAGGGVTTINGTAPVTVTGTGNTRTVAVSDATTTDKGVVQLADAAAITAGTAGLVVDAAQLKVVNDAISTATGGITSITANPPLYVAGTGSTRNLVIANATSTASGMMTAAEFNKLAGIADGAQVNVQADWNETDNTKDSFIANKPTIPTAGVTSVTAAANTGITVGGTATAPVVSGLDATTTAKGIVQLADAAAITAGTAGLVVTADQLLAANNWLRTGTSVSLTNVGDNVGVGVTPAANTKFDLKGAYAHAVVPVAALDIDCSLGNYFTKTINAASTFTVSNVPAGRCYSYTLELTHTSGAVTWFAGVQWPDGKAPTLTAGKTHLLMFVTDDGGARWRGCSLANYTN